MTEMLTGRAVAAASPAPRSARAGRATRALAVDPIATDRSRKRLSLFILYAVLIGLVLGFLVGGRPAGLAALQLRWSWVIVGGLLVQVVLFSEPVSERIGALGPPIYVASTAAVIAAVLANRAITGMLVVAAGRGEQPRRDRRERRLHAGGAPRPRPRWAAHPTGLLQQHAQSPIRRWRP